MITTRRILIATGTALAVLVFVAATVAAQMPQTTTQQIPAGTVVTTEQLRGTVLWVEGNNLVVKMSNGELKTFTNVPDSRTAWIDGKETRVRDLQVGTRLTATITKVATATTIKTTTVMSGQVRAVSGTTVVALLPNGDMKQYKVKPDYKFTVDGRPATVYDLKPGMMVTGEKITEEPTVEISSTTRVVGQAPPAPRPAPTPAPKAAQALAPVPAPAPVVTEAPKTLPKTGSPLPLAGLLGFAFVGGSYLVRKFRG